MEQRRFLNSDEKNRYGTRFEIIDGILEEKKLKYIGDSVYHFTSGQALKSMIETRSLWLSERQYMNDVKEVDYTKSIISNYLNKKNKGSYITKKEINEYVDFQDNQYVFSTCTKSDLVNMWNYYTNGQGISDSFCIEFDRKKLKDIFLAYQEENGNFYFGQVIYNKRDQEEIISETLEKLIEKSTDEICSKEQRMVLFEKYNYIVEYFYSLCKQEGHSAEKEYRFVFCSNENYEFEYKRGLFVPTRKIYLEEISKDLKLPIKSIMFGPNHYSKIGEQSLRNFLRKNGYQDKEVDITKSMLSLR